MTTQRTQTEYQQTRRATLKVNGTLLLIDAQMLEEACSSLRVTDREITVNLSGINCLTDGAAEVLSRLKQRRGVALEGMNLFVQQVIKTQEMALINGYAKDGRI